MDRNIKIYVEGIDKIMIRDLKKHKTLLERSKVELDTYRKAKTHEIKKKKYYEGLIGKGKFNDKSLKKSIQDININIRHMADKVKLSNDAIEHHTLIVNTLTQQLEEYNESMKELAKTKMK